MANTNINMKTSSVQQSVVKNAVDERLNKFCTSFVSEVETILHTYNLILEGKTDDEALNKLSTFSPQTTGELVGHSLGTLIGSFVCIPELGAEIGKVGGKQLAKWMSEKHYLEKIKKIKDVIDCFKSDEAKFRQDLVSTAVDIFQSYERQFINVSTDLGAEKAMLLLAKDAANRSLNYYKHNTFTPHTLVDSVVLGKSAKVWGLPLEGRGFSVKSNFNTIEEVWKTESLYNKVGLLRENTSKKKPEFYVKTNWIEKPEKFGFRRLFGHEKWDDIKGNYSTYTFQKGKKYNEYGYVLTSQNVEEKKRNILQNINEKDPNLMEDRIKDMIKELANDISEQINTIKKENKENGDCNKVLELVDEWFIQFASNLDVCNEIKHDVGKLDQKLDVNHEEMIEKLNKLEEALQDKTRNMKRKSVWFDIKDPVHLFTGRTEELAELHSMMQRNSERVTVISQMTSISGLGGIGKTELSRKYAQIYCEEYDGNVVWINAENKENLTDSFTRLARDELHISVKNIDGGEKDIKTIVADAYKLICEEKSLFIFDNVESSQDISEFLPRSLPPKLNKPYILITSRNREWDKGIEVKNLYELKVEDAIVLVKKGLDIDDESREEQIKKLAEKLQNFPLALRQAIAYIIDQQRVEEYNIEDYLKEYESQARDLLDSESFKGIDNDYSRTTFTTWKISTDKIACDIKHGKSALLILECIAYLAPENINRNIFLNLAENNDRVLKQAVRLLVRYSLLSGKPDQSVLSIHRLVQETTRLTLKEHGRAEERLCNVLMLIKTNLQNEYLDHAMSAWSHASENRKLVMDFSDLLSRIISELKNSARYEEASSFGVKAVDSLKRVLGDEHIDILNSENNIAEVFYRQGKYNDALEKYENVMEKKIKTFGESHQTTLHTLLKIAVVLNNRGAYNDALQKCSLVITQKGNSYDADRLAAMHEKARSLDNIGRYEEAVNAFKDVLANNDKSLAYATLYTQHGLGRALSNQGEYEEALSVYRTVLEQRNKLFGDEHPDSLATMNNIAVVLNKQGKYDDALDLYTEVLQKRIKRIGENHPSTLYTLHGISKVLKNKGLYQKSSEYFQKVIKTRTEVLGPGAPATLSSKREYAVLLSNQGKHQEALKKLQTVYRTRKELFGENHPSALSTMHEVAEAMKNCGEKESAFKVFEEVLEKRRAALGDDHPYTVHTRHSMAVIMLEQGRKGEALGIFRDVYEKRKKKLGEDHPYTLSTRIHIRKVEEEKVGK